MKKIYFTRNKHIKTTRIEGTYWAVVGKFKDSSYGGWNLLDVGDLPFFATNYSAACKMRQFIIRYLIKQSEHWNESNILVAKLTL